MSAGAESDQPGMVGTGHAAGQTDQLITAAVDSVRSVDLGRVLTGLRHLPASSEPARVFTELAAICVPALCDECFIEVAEHGRNRYRIRVPGLHLGFSVNGSPSNGVAETAFDRVDPAGSGGVAHGATVTVSDGRVTAEFAGPSGGGPEYAGILVCAWHHDYSPTEADAALVGVLVDHATALVHRERISNRATRLDEARQVGLALDATQRVAAATGILMALYHLTPAQARQLLARAGNRTHRTLREVADTVLHTGALPFHQVHSDNPSSTDVESETGSRGM